MLRIWSSCLLFASTAAACSTPPSPPARPAEARPAAAPAAREISFDLIGQGWVRLPVRVSGAGPTPATETVRMMFDTGGGVTLLSKKLCERMHCVPDGTFAGKRMSGQELQLPMARIAALEVGGHRVENARVAVLDTTSLLPPELEIEGSMGMDLFRTQPFTLDYATQRFVLEDATSLAVRRSVGTSVPVRVEHDGPSTVAFLPLTISPDTKPLEMEVDNGSLHLILDDRFLAAVVNEPAGVKRIEGRDQTDHPYVRSYGVLAKPLGVVGAPKVTAPAGATVMFQRIIHDGLVGKEFLAAHATTFDLERSTLTFAP